MDDHDGADAIERAWREGLKPDPLLTVSEWADRYPVLSHLAHVGSSILPLRTSFLAVVFRTRDAPSAPPLSVPFTPSLTTTERARGGSKVPWDLYVPLILPPSQPRRVGPPLWGGRFRAYGNLP
jgi:hypothetical protein